jgi:hypothetical protein
MRRKKRTGNQHQIEEHFLFLFFFIDEKRRRISLYCNIYVIDIDRTYMRVTITQRLPKKESISVSLEERLGIH